MLGKAPSMRRNRFELDHLDERPTFCCYTLRAPFYTDQISGQMKEVTDQRRSSGDALAHASSSSLEENFCEHRRRQNREAQRRYRSTTSPQFDTIAAGSIES